jgi:hypothetical protein
MPFSVARGLGFAAVMSSCYQTDRRTAAQRSSPQPTSYMQYLYTCNTSTLNYWYNNQKRDVRIKHSAGGGDTWDLARRMWTFRCGIQSKGRSAPFVLACQSSNAEATLPHHARIRQCFSTQSFVSFVSCQTQAACPTKARTTTVND